MREITEIIRGLNQDAVAKSIALFILNKEDIKEYSIDDVLTNRLELYKGLYKYHSSGDMDVRECNLNQSLELVNKLNRMCETITEGMDDSNVNEELYLLNFNEDIFDLIKKTTGTIELPLTIVEWYLNTHDFILRSYASNDLYCNKELLHLHHKVGTMIVNMNTFVSNRSMDFECIRERLDVIQNVKNSINELVSQYSSISLKTLNSIFTTQDYFDNNSKDFRVLSYIMDIPLTIAEKNEVLTEVMLV